MKFYTHQIMGFALRQMALAQSGWAIFPDETRAKVLLPDHLRLSSNSDHYNLAEHAHVKQLNDRPFATSHNYVQRRAPEKSSFRITPDKRRWQINAKIAYLPRVDDNFCHCDSKLYPQSRTNKRLTSLKNLGLAIFYSGP